jgi:hypothetical protein
MRRHQPGKGCAMLVKMLLLDAARLLRVAADEALDELAHPLVDQREQIRRGRIEAVVEIEDPALGHGEVPGAIVRPYINHSASAK